ncbi:hypothetical protein DICA4_F00144 [Diutina catenulata]
MDLATHPKLSWKHRMAALAWMSGVHGVYGLDPSVLFRATEQFDRVLCCRDNLTPEELPLIVGVALMISSKVESGTTSLTPNDIAQAFLSTGPVVMATEIEMLQTLDYSVTAPTVYHLASLVVLDTGILEVATVAMEMIKLDQAFVGSPQKLIVALSAYIAGACLRSKRVTLFGYTRPQLFKLARIMLAAPIHPVLTEKYPFVTGLLGSLGCPNGGGLRSHACYRTQIRLREGGIRHQV